jgi:arsenical pump membrane protein
VPALATRRVSGGDLFRAAAPAFLLFVLALEIVVEGVLERARAAGRRARAGRWLPARPAGGGRRRRRPGHLANNLPAILVLLPAVTAAGRGAVLAALIGVNVGPNLTYVGSLATLLWRRTLRERGAEPSTGEFLRLGALTVPLGLVAATVGLWIVLRIIE